MSDNSFDTWTAPAGWEPPKRPRTSIRTENPMHELRKNLGRGGFTAVPETTVISLMCHEAMPETVRTVSEAIADSEAESFRLRVDLRLPGPECADDRMEAAMALREQVPALSLVSALELRDGLDLDGGLTLPPLHLMDAMAVILQLYDVGFDATLADG